MGVISAISTIIVALLKLLGTVVVVGIIAMAVIVVKFMDDNSLDCDDVIRFVKELNDDTDEEDDE